MEPDGQTPDRAATCARVRRVIDELDNTSEDDSLGLLSKLLCAAWGSLTAQNQ